MFRNLPSRLLRFAAPAVLLLCCAAGCDRGGHPGQIGEMAPDFVIHDGDRVVQLSSYRGKVVLLNFWATWCPPCIDELPALEALHHQLPQVVILAVSVDEDAAAYQQFLIDNHIDLLSVRDSAQASNKLYGSVRFPESYAIDRQGVIRRKFISSQDWTSPEISGYLATL